MADDDVLTEPQAAAALRIATRTLIRWRMAGRVSFDRTPGGRIRYRWEDVVELRRGMRVASHVSLCHDKSGEPEPAAE